MGEALRQALEVTAKRSVGATAHLQAPVQLPSGFICDRVTIRRRGKGGAKDDRTPTLLELHEQGQGHGVEGRLFSWRQTGAACEWARGVMLRAFNERWRECDVKLRGVLVQAVVCEVIPLGGDEALIAALPRAMPLSDLAHECRKKKRDAAEAIISHLRRDEARLRRLAASASAYVASSYVFGLRCHFEGGFAIGEDGAFVCTDYGSLLSASPGTAEFWLPRAVKAALQDRWPAWVDLCMEAFSAIAVTPLPPPGPADAFSFWARARAAAQVLGTTFGVDVLRHLELTSTCALRDMLRDTCSVIYEDYGAEGHSFDVSTMPPPATEHLEELMEMLESFEEALSCLLASDTEDIRTRGAEELGLLWNKTGDHRSNVRSCLARLLSDSSKRVRLVASRALAQCGGGEDAAAAASAMLSDNHLDVRIEAIKTLAQLGEANAGAHAGLVACAFRSSTSIAPPISASARLSNILYGPGNTRRSAVNMSGDSGAAPSTSQGSRPLDAQVRMEAVSTLGQLGASGRQVLTELLNDASRTVRLEATRALGQLGPHGFEAASAVAERLADDFASVRLEAVRALALMDHEGFARSGDVARLFCREAMRAQLGAQGSIKPVEEVDPLGAPTASQLCHEVFVMLFAAGAFGEREVAGLLANSAEVVRLEAVRALVAVGAGGRSVTHIDALVCLLRDPATPVRVEAVEALAVMGELGALRSDEVAQLLHDTGAVARVAACRTLAALGVHGAAHAEDVSQLFRDESLATHLEAASVRTSAFRTLMMLGAAGVREANGLLADESPSVRRAALFALGQLSQPGEVPVFGSRERLVANLASSVAALLASEDVAVRQAALHALSLMGAPGACEIATVMTGQGPAAPLAETLRREAVGNLRVADARRLTIAQRREEDIRRNAGMQWRQLECPGRGIRFDAPDSVVPINRARPLHIM